MKTIFLKYKSRLLLFGLILFLFPRCTENPFFNENIDITNQLTVEGRVILNDDFVPVNIYVWLERFNLSTYTDSSGYFKLELPDPHLQPGGGMNGVYSIYYYVANYRVKTSSMLLLKGQIEYGSGDVDNRGRINQTVILQKLIDIKTEITPSEIAFDNKDPLDIMITLDNKIDSVRVATYKRLNGQTSCIIIKPRGAGIDSAFILQGIGTYLQDEWISNKTVWLMRYLFSVGFFPPGEYEFIPYIIIYQDNLPQELLDSIDEELLFLSYRYLNLPIKQQTGCITVKKNGE
ncbi:MAG TPA: hypothetical protein EYP36_06645 [Calditrichaeota bacterium]|nr:hypothetical protein [Calditrichota bacterium]